LAGTILGVGTYTLNAIFTPNDTADYAGAVASVSLTVNPAPSFTLSASPAFLSIAQTGSSTSTISVTNLWGFTGTVKLAASGVPSGVTASFSKNPTTNVSVLSLKVGPKATVGPTPITITGSSGSLTGSTSIVLTVVSHK
jgi:hypothetical protein